MRILNIESATNYSGGVNQLLINVKGLVKKGHNVSVACVYDSYVHRALKGENVNFVFIEEKRVYHSASVIRSFLKRNPQDIVHTHHPRGHTMGLLALIGKKREKLVVQRSVLFPTTNIFKYLNPRIDLFIANSQAVKEVMRKHFVSEKKIKVLYSAVEENKLNNINKETIRKRYGFRGNIFGVVGNYSTFKGHDMAMLAFKKLNLENATLVIVGKDTEKLEPVAKNLGIESSVKILGFKENAYEIMAGFDLLIVPSLQESFPNVIIEAFLLNVPVIGTNVGGIPELLDNGRGILCEPNPDSIAKAMLDMIATDRKKMTEKAFKFAKENLTAEKKVEKLIKIYEELINR